MKPKGIVLHCSDSTFGSSIVIDSWHRERGWDNVGYHFVICNGQVENDLYMGILDGAIERGRDINKGGAHAKGYNDYIGICLIGKEEFTDAQFRSLQHLIIDLKMMYGISNDNVIGHCDVSSKSCPNFDVTKFKHDYL